MDDDLEKLIHELAGQEMERLRRKNSRPVNNTTYRNGHYNDTDENVKAFSGFSQFHNTKSDMTSQNNFVAENPENDAICQKINSHPMTYSPNTTYSANQLEHNRVSTRGYNYEFATLIRPRKFQIFPRYSQDLFIPRDNNNLFESNFARSLQQTKNLPLDNTWNIFR